jgi:ABC-type transport system substrate-binding protein
LENALGWDITLQVMESGAGFDAYWAGDYGFAVQGGSIFMNDPDAIFARDIRGTTPQWVGGGRGKYYAPPGLEEFFDQQVQEPDPDKRRAIVQEMGDIRDAHSANPYIYWQDRHHGVEDLIQNFHFTCQGMRWEHVWCDPAC